MREYNAAGLLFPVRVRTGGRKGELAWMPLQHWRVLRTLHNPRYVGAFAYGRRRERVGASGIKTFETLPRDQWIALIPDSHPGYLSWEQYEANQRLLPANARARGTDRAAGPPWEGPALLQGMAICDRLDLARPRAGRQVVDELTWRGRPATARAQRRRLNSADSARACASCRRDSCVWAAARG